MADIARAVAAWFQSRWARDDRGASLVEYALLISLIAIVCMGAISYFGSSNAGSVDDSATKIVVAN
jgi:pilus assembly protein Flp/PilA